MSDLKARERRYESLVIGNMTGQEQAIIPGFKMNDTNSLKLQARRGKREYEQRHCSNCGTSSTSTWRTLDSKIVCNACKCFFRKHGFSRPIEMRKDSVSSRNRSKSRNVFPHESVFTINSSVTVSNHPVCEEWEAAKSFCYLLQSYFEQ